MFLLSMLLDADRVRLSSAKNEIAADLRLTDTHMGWVLSIFFFCLAWIFPYLKSRYDLSMVEAGFYAAAPPLAGAFGAILRLSVAVFGADMTIAPSWTVCIDIARKHAGTVSGTMNMAGNPGSFITVLAFPCLLKWTGALRRSFTSVRC